MIDGKNAFAQPINNHTKTLETLKHMKTLEKLSLVKEMVTQLAVC